MPVERRNLQREGMAIRRRKTWGVVNRETGKEEVLDRDKEERRIGSGIWAKAAREEVRH